MKLVLNHGNWQKSYTCTCMLINLNLLDGQLKYGILVITIGKLWQMSCKFEGSKFRPLPSPNLLTCKRYKRLLGGVRKENALSLITAYGQEIAAWSVTLEWCALGGQCFVVREVSGSNLGMGEPLYFDSPPFQG